MAVIELEVDEETAREYPELPETERQRLEAAMAVLVRAAAHGSPRPPEDVARDCASVAEANGMTPEIAERLIRD